MKIERTATELRLEPYTAKHRAEEQGWVVMEPKRAKALEAVARAVKRYKVEEGIALWHGGRPVRSGRSLVAALSRLSPTTRKPRAPARRRSK